MAIYKTNTKTEFYLFMNGKLIYKLWPETGQSLVFDVMPYLKKTFVSLKSKIPK